jgi:uncharacterized protein (TIGR00730 family)
MTIKNIAVFCGAKFGNQDIIQQEMKNLGILLASKNIGLVYGGAGCGLMGILAKSMLEKNAKVIGVIPNCLLHVEKPPALENIILVKSMHERKQYMSKLSDAFILAPGGFGSLDEFFEILTWKQLNIHQKPIFILNINQFFQPLIQYIDHAINKDFILKQDKQLFTICNQIDELKTFL